MSDDLRIYLHKAEQYLAAAKLLATTEFPNGAVTDSCYAFFWMVRGLLYKKGIITKRHSGLKDMFGLHYVKTEVVPKHFAQYLEILFDRRQQVDYEINGELPIDEINDCIRRAEDFLTFVRTKYA